MLFDCLAIEVQLCNQVRHARPEEGSEHYFAYAAENRAGSGWRDRLNMFVVQRSGDMFLGVPYDVALFAKVLLYIAEKTNLKANYIDVQIVDAHVYNNQHDAINKYLDQETFQAPDYIYENGVLTLINYKHGPIISAKVAI